jgi:hypothetical protein
MFKTQKMDYLLNNKLNKNIVREEEKQNEKNQFHFTFRYLSKEKEKRSHE